VGNQITMQQPVKCTSVDVISLKVAQNEVFKVDGHCVSTYIYSFPGLPRILSAPERSSGCRVKQKHALPLHTWYVCSQCTDASASISFYSTYLR